MQPTSVYDTSAQTFSQIRALSGSIDLICLITGPPLTWRVAFQLFRPREARSYRVPSVLALPHH
jgi:hypothetical protein